MNECKRCKGTGWIMRVVGPEGDVDHDMCDCGGTGEVEKLEEGKE
jgi:hypothetical protein